MVLRCCTYVTLMWCLGHESGSSHPSPPAPGRGEEKDASQPLLGAVITIFCTFLAGVASNYQQPYTDPWVWFERRFDWPSCLDRLRSTPQGEHQARLISVRWVTSWMGDQIALLSFQLSRPFFLLYSAFRN